MIKNIDLAAFDIGLPLGRDAHVNVAAPSVEIGDALDIVIQRGQLLDSGLWRLVGR